MNKSPTPLHGEEKLSFGMILRSENDSYPGYSNVGLSYPLD